MTFNPATLTLNGYLRGSFSADPWTGTASAGLSGDGSHGLFGSGVTPGVGSAVNGFTPATFNGSTQAFSGSGTLWSGFLTATAGTISMLVKATSAASDLGAGSRIGNPGLLCQDTGSTAFGLGYSTAGATIAIFDSAYRELVAPLPTGVWGLVQCKWDGANLFLRVNGTLWQSIACTGPFLSALAMKVGVAYDGTTFWAGSILDIILAPSALSDATCNDLGTYVQDRYGVSLGFSPPLVNYPHRIDRRQHERFRQHAARSQFYAGPVFPPSSLTQLQPFAPIRPDRIDGPKYRAVHQDPFEMNALPIPTDTTALAVGRTTYPDQVRGLKYATKNQDAFEMNPFPIAAAFSPINPLSTFADTVARRRPTQPQADVLPPQQIANPFSPINPLVEFPDTVPRPRFGAYLHLHVTSLNPQPERTSPIVSVVHPDRVMRPQMAPAMMRFTALDPKPEQKIALGFQGRFPSEVRRPRYDARHQQPFTFWPLPIPNPPVVAVPIVTQNGTVVLLSAHGAKVVKLDAQSSTVSLLTARGVRVVRLDAQSGEVRLLSARYGKTE